MKISGEDWGVLDAASYSEPIITAIYGIILFQAGKKNRRYRMSGTVLLVTGIIKIVYLHRMVVAFRDYDDTELTVYEAER